MDSRGWYRIAMGYDDSGMPLLAPSKPPCGSDDLERQLSKRAFPHRLASLRAGVLRYLARFDMSRHVIATETPLDDMALDSEPRDTLQETPLRETKVA